MFVQEPDGGRRAAGLANGSRVWTGNFALKDRRKNAGVKRDSDQFAPFKRLMEYVHREEATLEQRSEEDEAVRKGVSILRKYGKTLLPELQTRLGVYGLRAGKLYREDYRTA